MNELTIPADASLYAINCRQTATGEVVDLVAITEDDSTIIAEGVRFAFTVGHAQLMSGVS